jgi:AcrR family transcriptional regulator/acyl-CoA thioesterase FadM
VSESRRSELLDATRRVIARAGFAGATVEAITREAGASIGLLNYHFPSKDSIVAEAFADMARDDLAELRAISGHAGTPPERLATFVAILDFSDGTSWRTWVDAWGVSVHVGALRRTLERFARGWRTVLADVLADGARGGYWSCPDPEESATRLVAALDGIGLHAALHPGEMDPVRALAWARRAVELEVGIVLPDAVAPALAGGAPDPEPAATTTRLAVRLDDVDAGGCVPAAALVAYLREGRDAWLRARFGATADRAPELLVVRVALDAQLPLRRDDAAVTVSVALDRLGWTSVRTQERLATAGGRPIARADVTLVACDDEGRSRPLTPPEREALCR